MANEVIGGECVDGRMSILHSDTGQQGRSERPRSVRKQLLIQERLLACCPCAATSAPVGQSDGYAVVVRLDGQRAAAGVAAQL